MKSIQGIVTSLKADKTAKVSVERMWAHPLYGKSVKRNKGYACHYEGIKLVEGDIVEIEACVPVSKTKRFRVVKKVEK
ncbi:MAG: 30S ribosomal protein S17 [Pseudomonadales bacterium]|nr:30S ribosomal protein S17 [Pseudomonadales bacterium]